VYEELTCLYLNSGIKFLVWYAQTVIVNVTYCEAVLLILGFIS